MKGPITTHVLDTAAGKPAAGVGVMLDKIDDGMTQRLADAETDADGRCMSLLPPGTLPSGTYRISFATGRYFAADGRDSFYPEVSIVFVVKDGSQHYHVPLLISPFGYTTYRGS